MADLPLEGVQYTSFKNDEFMEIKIKVSSDGPIEGATHTWTYNKSHGFKEASLLSLLALQKIFFLRPNPSVIK